MDHEALSYQLARTAQQKAIRARRRKQASSSARSATVAEPLLSPSQKTGRLAENHACLYLQARGLIMLERNLRSKTGELDLIANDHGILVFIELRHRVSRQYGGARTSANHYTRLRVTRTPQFFLPPPAPRFL